MAALWNDLLKGSGRHTLSLGEPSDNDVVLYSEDCRKGSKFLSEVKHTFSYYCKEGERITAVVAHDKWSDDTGGHPEVLSGGTGRNHVTIEVTSERNRGFHFLFKVYGTKERPKTERSPNITFEAFNAKTSHVHTKTPNTSGKLSIDDLKDVLARTWDARAKWYNIGLEVGITANTLDSLDRNHQGNCEECYKSMLKEWLRTGPTWSGFAKALRSQTVGMSDLADELPS